MTERGHRLAEFSRIRSFAARFSRAYWTFFAVAFCMDLGFGLFFFLFNLYLTALHFDERFIGHVMGCLTLGNVAGTIPAMLLARRRGLRALLLLTFICTPLLSVLRVLVLWEPAQLGLAFATGVALCGWPICFSPAVAGLTDESNRSLGFSIAFATGIGLGTVAGAAGGYIPEWLHASAVHLPIADGIRAVLLAACGITLLGLLPLRRLQLRTSAGAGFERTRILHPFLLRFLPAFAVWNVVTGSFPVFGAIYLEKILAVPLGRVGAVFSASHLVQLGAVLAAPLLFKRAGIARGVALIQLGVAFFLVLIAGTRNPPLAIVFYLLYLGSQYMCGPGIYNLLMNSIPEAERSTASAVQNLCGALSQAGTAALTGICIVTFGYNSVLFANAAIAAGASFLFFMLGSRAEGAATGLLKARNVSDSLPDALTAPAKMEAAR